MKEKKVRVREFIIDLQLFEVNGLKEVTDSDWALEEIGKFMKGNDCISELVLCHGRSCYPGKSLELLMDGVKQSDLKRLSFQAIVIGSSWSL